MKVTLLVQKHILLEYQNTEWRRISVPFFSPRSPHGGGCCHGYQYFLRTTRNEKLGLAKQPHRPSSRILPYLRLRITLTGIAMSFRHGVSPPGTAPLTIISLTRSSPSSPCPPLNHKTRHCRRLSPQVRGGGSGGDDARGTPSLSKDRLGDVPVKADTDLLAVARRLAAWP